MPGLVVQVVTSFAAICMLSACGSGNADVAKIEDGNAARAETGSAQETVDNTEEERNTKAAPKLSETDRFMLDEAATACKSQNHKAFFDAFIRSAAVRQKYSAAKIDYTMRSFSGGDILSKKTIAAADHADFPLKMVDYYRKPVKSVKAGDDEYVELVVNQSQENRISVEWARVLYQGPSEGGDDLGQPVDLDGKAYDPTGFKDGQLLFYPTQDCWQLVADTRYQRL